MKISKYLIFTFIILFAYSCEKEVNFDLKAEADKMVIEGNIENNSYPIVRLSKTIGFFSSINYEQIANAVIRGADVYVSDDNREIKLKEFEIPIGEYKLYYFSVDNSIPEHQSFKGEVGKSYKLRIVHEGKEYTATTSIPRLNEGIDSIYHEPFNFAKDDTALKNIRNVKIIYKDPPDEENYVRLFVSRNGTIYEAPQVSIFSDLVTNGGTVPISVLPPFSPFDTTDFRKRDFFKLGDTVYFKWCSVDKNTYDFYNTLNFSQNSIGNPFSAPVQVTSNIKGGALGVWAGYGTKYYQYIIKE